MIAVTHGHGDHVGDTVSALAGSSGCADRRAGRADGWLGDQGANDGHLPGLNKGGSREIDGIKFTLTNAFHSSSSDDGDVPRASRAGIVIRLENGRTIYFAGDTCVFGDMALIARHLRARRGRAADRRPLHDGPARGRGRARAAREPALRAVATGARSRSSTGTPEELRRLAPEATVERHRARRRSSRADGVDGVTYSIAACDLDAGQWGVATSRSSSRSARSCRGPSPGRRDRDAGLRESALRARRARAAARRLAADEVVERLTRPMTGATSASSASSTAHGGSATYTGVGVHGLGRRHHRAVLRGPGQHPRLGGDGRRARRRRSSRPTGSRSPSG